MGDYSELVKRLRGYPEIDECEEAAAALEAQAKEIAGKDARIAELEADIVEWKLSHESRCKDWLYWKDKHEQQSACIAELETALKDATVRLIAAVSLLERGGKKGAPSNKMFEQMLVDYKNGIKRARAALKGER